MTPPDGPRPAEDAARRPWPDRMILGAIRRYQAFSRFTPPMCRYSPTCSEYARIAVTRYGARRGLWLAVRRICRCNPFFPGGPDPVP